jgi:tartrate dehydratase beta subunit/fumarate hydratase class I family protein
MYRDKNIINMDYYNTPSQNNQKSHKKALSPTTAHSMQSIAGYRSSANLMSGVRL